jgi:P4 family phage/plasmid primase-like protien
MRSSRTTGEGRLTPQLDIAPYRTAIPIREVCRELGIDVNGTGFIKCRSHGESNASCRVYSDHLHCHACGWHVDSIDLIRHETRADLWAALGWIAERSGLPAPKRDAEAQKVYESRKTVSEVYAAIFKDSLKQAEKGLQYLESRGIRRDIVEGSVGFLPEDYKPGNWDEARATGLLSRNGNLLFSGRIIIPIIHTGAVVSLYGRILGGDRKPVHVYPGAIDPKMPETLFGLSECRNEKTVYLTESIIDCLTLRSHGLHALGCFGTQGLTGGRIATLRATKIEKVILVFDSDANGSGHRGALKAGEALFKAGLYVEILNLPLDGKEKTDPNSFFRDHGAEDFRALERREYFDLRLDEIPRTATVKDQASAARPLIRLVAELRDELLDKGLLKQIQQRCPDLATDVLAKRVKEYRRKELNDLPTGSDFLPDLYADAVLKDRHAIYYHGDFHFWKDGCYRKWHELEVKRLFQSLGRGQLRRVHIDDSIHSLMVKTHVPDDKVNRAGLINLQNGYIDLSEEDPIPHPHSPELLSTIQLPIEYDEKAECPLFLRFLEQKVPDPSLRSLVQEMFGYILEPSTRYQKGFSLIGKSGTGKSTLLKILSDLVGPNNRSNIKLEKLGERFQVAALDGKLVNISSEVSEKVFLDDGTVKALIAGDEVTGERKHQDPYSFVPTCRLVVAANTSPLTHDTSNAFFRRWIPIPFDQELAVEKWDWDLHDKIKIVELPGVLLFALAGLARLRAQNGFTKSEASIQALEKWKREIDPVQEFAHLFLKPAENERVLLKILFDSFHEWAGKTNRKARYTDKNLKMKLEGAGFTFRHTKEGRALEGHWLAYPSADD